MLDGILGRGGFSTKCKSLIKLTKTRIDVIRRKRNATQKFLRKDVADLLSNGLDINAYGRAEGLLLEVILSSCYDFVEACCDMVLKNLSVMQKQRECPDECRAAVGSLMFAAARFSDLPELRDLRQMFYERFGDSLSLFEDEEFKENLASKPSTLENKVRLMKEIAAEFSIKWDSKAFEQRMNKPSLSPQKPPKAHRVFHVGTNQCKPSNLKEKVLKDEGHGMVFKERFDHNDGHGKLRNEKDGSISKVDAGDVQTRHGLSVNGHNKSHNGWEEAKLKKDSHDNSVRGRQEFVPERHAQAVLSAKEDAIPRTVKSGNPSQRKVADHSDAGAKLPFPYGRENYIPKLDSRDTELQAKPDFATPQVKSNGKEKLADDNGHGQQIAANSSSKDEVSHKPKSYNMAIPPVTPHVKSNGKEKIADDNHHGQQPAANSTTNDEVEHKPKSYKNMAIPPPYVKRYDKAQVRKHSSHSSDDGLERNDTPKNVVTHTPEVVQQGHDRSARERHHFGPDKDRIYHDDPAVNHIPKPRSSRRRHSRSRSFQLDAADFEESAPALPRKSRSRRKEDPRRGLQVLFDDEHHQKDEEERIIDKLLMHYSKKPSAYEPGKPRRKSKSRHAHHGLNETDESARGSREEPVSHARSVSLPRELPAQSSAPKVFTRAATFQDRSDEARHVHPKLPDYDDLAARFAALRGR